MNKKVELSIIIPVYNEFDNLLDITEVILKSISGEINSFEIIYIDDGSTDGSTQLLDEFADTYSVLKVIHLGQNKGQTTALAAGLAIAQGELIATLDADLQVKPDEIRSFVSYMDEVDMVVGVRENKYHNFITRCMSLIGIKIRNLVLNDNLRDICCPFKVFRKEVIKDMYFFDGFHCFLPVIARNRGYNVIEAPVTFYPRKHGKSQFKHLMDSIKIFCDSIAVRWMCCRDLSCNRKDFRRA